MSINLNRFVPDSKIFDNIKPMVMETIRDKDEDNSGKGSFLDVLKSKMDEVNNKQVVSEDITQGFIKGDSDIDIDKVMLAGEEAKGSLKLAIEVRNKLIDAFQELSRTQI